MIVPGHVATGVRLRTITLLTLVSGWVKGLIHVLLEGMGRPPPQPLIGGDDDGGAGVDDAAERLRREAAEDDVCTAPMRVQASMAMAASGTMGI